MSWAEIFKINKNMRRSLDEQLQDMKFQPIRVITANTTYTPEKTGLYKIICVGKGGYGYASVNSGSQVQAWSGGGGGVAIKTIRMTKGDNCNITVGTTASFVKGDISISATAGGNGTWNAGTVVGGSGAGGDYNYTGENGAYMNDIYVCPIGGSVGVYISDLHERGIGTITLGGNDSRDTPVTVMYTMGRSILGFGGGGSSGAYSDYSYGGVDVDGLPAAVLIIPIEMEE